MTASVTRSSTARASPIVSLLPAQIGAILLQGLPLVLARGVRHLLHEAWSTSRAPEWPDKDATAADAARVASEAGVGDLTLIHLNPKLIDFAALADDARPTFNAVTVGEDQMVLTSIPRERENAGRQPITPA